MNKYEQLTIEASNQHVRVHDFNLPKGLEGLYIDGNIAIRKDLETSVEKACILAEELGHHYTTVGDITALDKASDRKQERLARLWSYNKLVGLNGIIKAYKHNCSSISEMAEYLDVTEEFLNEALECYRQKYGCRAILDNYIIYFEPRIGVLELIN